MPGDGQQRHGPRHEEEHGDKPQIVEAAPEQRPADRVGPDHRRTLGLGEVDRGRHGPAAGEQILDGDADVHLVEDGIAAQDVGPEAQDERRDEDDEKGPRHPQRRLVG